MFSFYTKIGDHRLFLTADQPELFKNLMKHFYIFQPLSSCQPDMAITIRSGYGVPLSNYEVKIAKTRSTIIFSRSDYEIKVDSDYKEAQIWVHDELALKHALMNLYSSFIIKNNWGLLIHSSCVVEEGTAHIFAGHSGAGKSTAAELSEPRLLLSDEATLVKIEPDRILVYNSPFRSEQEPTVLLGTCPLSSVDLLIQSPTTKRFPMKKSDGLMSLFDKIFYWDHDQQETIQVMRMLKMLVQQIPVYELYFQKNKAFWELIS